MPYASRNSRLAHQALGFLLLNGAATSEMIAGFVYPDDEPYTPERMKQLEHLWGIVLERLYLDGFVEREQRGRVWYYSIKLNVIVEVRSGVVDDISVYLHPATAVHVTNAIRELAAGEPVTNWDDQKPENYDLSVFLVTPDGRG